MSALPSFLIQLHQQLAENKTKESAWAIVQEYLSFFGVSGAEKDLWQMLVASLVNNEMDEFKSTRHRYDLIFFFEFTMMFMESVDLLNQQHNKKQEKINYE